MTVKKFLGMRYRIGYRRLTEKKFPSAGMCVTFESGTGM